MRIHERTRRRVSLALVAVLPLFLMSFAGRCGGGNKNGADAAAQQEREVDDLLRKEVRKSISRRAGTSTTGLSAVDLHVDSVKRRVILTGTVKSEAARDEAVRAARETEVEKDGQKLKPADVDASGLTVKPGAP